MANAMEYLYRENQAGYCRLDDLWEKNIIDATLRAVRISKETYLSIPVENSPVVPIENSPL